MRLYSVALGIFAGFGSFLFGYDTGIITTSIAHPSFKTYMGNPNSAWTGAIVATYIAGEVVGALLQSALGDRLGRKRFMGLMCIVVTIGTIIQTAAQNFGMFLGGRIVTGIAVGALVGTVPIYNVEIAPPEIRGLIGGMSGFMIGVGTFLANWVGYACGFAPYGQFQWRFPLALQIPPGVILFIGLIIFLPESPRWLIRKGRDDEAFFNFSKIRGVATAELRQEFEDTREQVLYEQRTEVKSFREAWVRYKKRVLIAIAVQTMTSLTGVNVLNYYQSTLYKGFGIKGQTVLLLSAIYGTVGFLANIASICYVDKAGRVKLFKIGLPTLVGVLVYSAIMGHFFNTGNNQVGKGFSILGIYLYTIVYYLTINSTTWLYGVEVLPVSLRSTVTGWAAASHFIFNIAVTEAGPTAFATIHENYYYVFVGTMTFFTVIVWLYFPETAGRSLEAIAESFGDKVVSADEVASQAPDDLKKVQDEQLEGTTVRRA